MRRITKGIVFALLLAGIAISVWAQGTYTAASCSLSDVNAVINGPTHKAVDGDTINIPVGSCTWAGGITVPARIGISIIGAGSGSTTIIDNSGSSNLFYFQPIYGASFSRVSGLTLSPKSGVSANSLAAPLAFQGACSASGCPNIRVDHLVFPATPPWEGLTYPSNTMVVTDNVFGVLDHNSLSENGANGYYEFVNFNHSAWQGVGQYGDNSWASPTDWGSSQALYLEDNHFEQIGGALFPITETEGGFGYTNEGGGRVVCRFNTGVGLRSMCVNHGTESNGRPRGGRKMEFYKNSMSCPNSSYPGCFSNDMLFGAGPRSGSLLAMANSFTWGPGTGINLFEYVVEYRTLQSFPVFGACDGAGQWDFNDGHGAYDSGTFTRLSISGNNWTITDASKSWTPNQWVSNGSPYSIHDVTTGEGSEITGNGTNTISGTFWTSGNFASGNSYQILRATACIDQSSRSGGSLLSDNPPTPTNSSRGLMNQSLDPLYEAADTATGNPVTATIGTNTARIIANRDYYGEVSQSAQSSPTSPFNGTVGTGYGTLANRPTTCTPRVGYWATDQGSWNQSGTGGQGQLYVCTATNTWSLYYTPYTYPHPLTGTVTPPAPPTNLREVAH